MQTTIKIIAIVYLHMNSRQTIVTDHPNAFLHEMSM